MKTRLDKQNLNICPVLLYPVTFWVDLNIMSVRACVCVFDYESGRGVVGNAVDLLHRRLDSILTACKITCVFVVILPSQGDDEPASGISV